MKDVLSILDLPADAPPIDAGGSPRLPFDTAVSLVDVSFNYPNGSLPVIDGVSLEIEKGTRVGFVGRTGSGKSTITDLIMGLLLPTTGVVRVDGTTLDESNLRLWQACVAHVPQAIFLADSTIAENIAFGVPVDQIDMERVRRVAHWARLGEFISTLPNGVETVVGERGVRLSGGQRQRIGLARALYKEASLLVLDEATSALDSETESEIMQAIESLDRRLTVVIIAHRLSTLRICDKIFRLENGKLMYEPDRDYLREELQTRQLNLP